MGVQAYQQILKKEKVSTNPEHNALVQRVGRRIAEATGRKDYQWEFKVIENDKMINAFALPGGKVAVYTGILPVTRDEAGLAAVMGHEVAHAIARHGGERVSQGLLVQVGLGVVQAALGSQDPATTKQVATLLGAGAAVGLILPFSRSQESEADRLGMIYMAKAGYDPHAARDLWVRMGQASKGQQKPPEFLSTHPANQTRIRQIEAWMPEAMRYYDQARRR
jgi:predicted Zn-dependent protease